MYVNVTKRIILEWITALLYYAVKLTATVFIVCILIKFVIATQPAMAAAVTALMAVFAVLTIILFVSWRAVKRVAARP